VPALPNLRLISHKSSICFFERFAWQAVFSRPFFQKNYPHSLAKCLSCRCRQQREKYAVLRQEQSVSCQSKILPRYHNSLSAHSVPSESCWGVPSPNPALPLRGKEKRLNRICKQSVNFSKRGVRFLPIFLEVYEEVFTRARYMGAETERK
jgi:hypothetical protein